MGALTANMSMLLDGYSVAVSSADIVLA